MDQVILILTHLITFYSYISDITSQKHNTTDGGDVAIWQFKVPTTTTNFKRQVLLIFFLFGERPM